MMAYFQIAFQSFMIHYANGYVPAEMLRFIFLMGVSDLMMVVPIPGLAWNPDPNPYRYFAGTEWRTWQGAYHLAWSVPQTATTYYRPGITQFLSFFGPFVAVGKWKQAVGLLVTGPPMADWIVGGDVNQSASVWCFQSVVIAFVPIVKYSNLSRARKVVAYIMFACLLCYNYYLVWWLGAMRTTDSPHTSHPFPTCLLTAQSAR